MAKQKAKNTKKSAKPKRDELEESQENLMWLVALQLVGYIIFEAVVYVFVFLGWIPKFITIYRPGVINIHVSVAFVIIVSLLAVLVAAFWVAILVEVFGVMKVEKIEL